MQDLLPKAFKIMTKDINTISSKGVSSNKSLFSKLTSNIKLPRDKYLMPTLGVQVKDSLLAFFGINIWGNFDINLQPKLAKNIIMRVQKQKIEWLKKQTRNSIKTGKSVDGGDMTNRTD